MEKAVEKAEQDGYDVGVAETKKTFRVEVSRICRTNYLQVWNEALNQAGVEASSALRKAKSVYYLLAIWASGPSGSKADTIPKDLDPNKGVSTKALPSSNDPPKDIEQVRAVEKKNETTKGVVPEATKPPVAPQRPF